MSEKIERRLLFWQAVLLQEGAVHMLLQILSLEATSSVSVANLDWFVCRWVASFHLNCLSHL
jgi:hypothetical protein